VPLHGNALSGHLFHDSHRQRAIDGIGSSLHESVRSALCFIAVHIDAVDQPSSEKGVRSSGGDGLDVAPLPSDDHVDASSFAGSCFLRVVHVHLGELPLPLRSQQRGNRRLLTHDHPPARIVRLREIVEVHKSPLHRSFRQRRHYMADLPSLRWTIVKSPMSAPARSRSRSSVTCRRQHPVSASLPVALLQEGPRSRIKVPQA